MAKSKDADQLLIHVAAKQTEIAENVATIAEGVRIFKERHERLEAKVSRHGRQINMGQGALALIGVVAGLTAIAVGIARFF